MPPIMLQTHSTTSIWWKGFWFAHMKLLFPKKWNVYLWKNIGIHQPESYVGKAALRSRKKLLPHVLGTPCFSPKVCSQTGVFSAASRKWPIMATHRCNNCPLPSQHMDRPNLPFLPRSINGQLSIQLSPATHRDSLTTEGVKTGRKSQSLQFLVEILMED